MALPPAKQTRANSDIESGFQFKFSVLRINVRNVTKVLHAPHPKPVSAYTLRNRRSGAGRNRQHPNRQHPNRQHPNRQHKVATVAVLRPGLPRRNTSRNNRLGNGFQQEKETVHCIAK